MSEGRGPTTGRWISIVAVLVVLLAVLTTCGAGLVAGYFATLMLKAEVSAQKVSDSFANGLLPDVPEEQKQVTEAVLDRDPRLKKRILDWAESNRAEIGLAAPSDVSVPDQRVTGERYELVGLGKRYDRYFDAYVVVVAVCEYREAAGWQPYDVSSASARVVLEPSGPSDRLEPLAGSASDLPFDSTRRPEKSRWPDWVARGVRALADSRRPPAEISEDVPATRESDVTEAALAKQPAVARLAKKHVLAWIDRRELWADYEPPKGARTKVTLIGIGSGPLGSNAYVLVERTAVFDSESERYTESRALAVRVPLDASSGTFRLREPVLGTSEDDGIEGPDFALWPSWALGKVPEDATY